MHEKNGLAKGELRTIVTMKELILIDSGLHNRFWVEVI